jgi:Zn-dependent protease with chaperone function
MYELLGLCLALASLLALNSAASLVASLLWRGLAPALDDWPATARASLLFTLRLLPATAAAVVVCLILLPAYIAHEPRHTNEEVGFTLAGLACLSAAGLLLAGWRGIATWLATRRLLRDWLQNAAPLPVETCSLPAYRLRHPFPVVALVGTWRPRLFIAEQLLAELSPVELAAALAHEAGHLAARDNSKRALLRACRDALTLVPCGRSLDRAWDNAAEEAADEYAARADQQTALNLAAALVKIARLVPPQLKPATPVSVSFIDADAGVLTRRVQRLVQMAELANPRYETLTHRVVALQMLSLGAVFCLAFLVSSNPALLPGAHWLLEVFVRGLQ